MVGDNIYHTTGKYLSIYEYIYKMAVDDILLIIMCTIIILGGLLCIMCMLSKCLSHNDTGKYNNIEIDNDIN